MQDHPAISRLPMRAPLAVLFCARARAGCAGLLGRGRAEQSRSMLVIAAEPDADE